MSSRKMSRRRFMAQTALASTAVIAAPYVRGAHAAGKLSIGFWDHWVPGANATSTKLCQEWAAKEKVDISIDYITTVGEKLQLTCAAEAQAKAGHDILAFQTWYPADQAENLSGLKLKRQRADRRHHRAVDASGDLKLFGLQGEHGLSAPLPQAARRACAAGRHPED